MTKWYILTVHQTDFDILSHCHENCEATLVSDNSEDEPADFIDDDEHKETVSHFVGDNVDDDIEIEENDFICDDDD